MSDNKPKRASEAERQMAQRLEEYQKKREQRVREKEQERLEKERKLAEKKAKWEAEEAERRQGRGRYKAPQRTRSNTGEIERPKKPKDARGNRSLSPTRSTPETKRGGKKKPVNLGESLEDTADPALSQAQKEAEQMLKDVAAAKAKADALLKDTPPKASSEADLAAAKKEAAQKQAQTAQEKATAAKAAEKQAAEKAQAEKIKAKKEAIQEAAAQTMAAEKAGQKATNAQSQKWKEAQAKKKTAAGGKDPPVERVPKLSALLAMGGPEAEDYKKKQQQAKLATWKSHADDKWHITTDTFEGTSLSEVTASEVLTDLTVDEAVEKFSINPELYIAMHYWPQQPDKFTFILRAGTIGYEPMGVKTDGSGRFVIMQHIYKRLEAFQDNLLPAPKRDKFTDSMTFGGKKLHSGKSKNIPLLPGRGMGLGDEANMELMGDMPQPAHVRQGACVGDCWLLSAIACLADFDFAVKRLFRKTPGGIDKLPQDQPNQYTVTLWDLKTWKEVDVVVDERLPVRADGTGYLLGAKPSRDGKYWVPYLEKAIAAHAGGFDKLNGGNCTDAWPLLTGSRNQFVITKNPKTGKYQCGAKYNPQDQKWTDLTNSPHDCNPGIWQCEWPKVGGGGAQELELTGAELFKKVIAWDENNFLIGAATGGASDKQSTDGIVDNHAYSVIDSRQNICGTGIDLLLIRNPWGEGGELENGQFMRSGPGWSKYPDIEKELNPPSEDNGLCWVTAQEFFKYFPIIYVCAFNMTRLQDPKYVNDLKDDFTRRPKSVAKPKPKPAPVEDEFAPIIVNKTSDPSSPYKITEQFFNGGFAFSEMNKKVIKGVSIAKGVDEFRTNPEKYLAIHYQTDMCTLGAPIQVHQFTYIFREGTEGLEIDEVPKGKRTFLMNVLK